MFTEVARLVMPDISHNSSVIGCMCGYMMCETHARNSCMHVMSAVLVDAISCYETWDTARLRACNLITGIMHHVTNHIMS